MMKRNRRSVTPEDAIIRLETLCASSEQCTSDLLKKLRNWEISPDDSERIIDSLSERRFVDDSRFAEAYARDKMRFSRWGRNKIKAGLYAKRISSRTIDCALDLLDPREYAESCLSALRAKVRSASLPNDYDGRTRLFRFGAARGFETQLLSTVIKSGKPWMEADSPN